MFLNAIKSTIDYCLFTLGFVIAVQLPEFIQQYKQFLAGKLSESQWHLSSYQSIADQQFAGSLKALVDTYKQSDQLAIQQTGDHVATMVDRHNTITQQLNSFDTASYIDQIIAMISGIKIEDAQTVLSYYQLAVPLTVEAISTGVIFAFLLVWSRMILTSLLHKLVGRSSHPSY
ncbi:DUF2937 family protein [Thalassotalea euphylliae]|uniref:DUF2937 family protein n=1 Tax=Thalassotalea euphylliae TaxID=1655234 RepID=UPI003624E513